MSRRAVHTDQLACQRAGGSHGGINAMCQRGDVVIHGADNDAFMAAAGVAMEAQEVEAVEGQHGALCLAGKPEDLLVWQALICPASLQGGEHVVTQLAEGEPHAAVEVLIGVKARHGRSSCLLVFTDGLVDLRLMRRLIGPRGGKGALVEAGVGIKQLFVREAETA